MNTIHYVANCWRWIRVFICFYCLTGTVWIVLEGWTCRGVGSAVLRSSPPNRALCGTTNTNGRKADYCFDQSDDSFKHEKEAGDFVELQCKIWWLPTTETVIWERGGMPLSINQTLMFNVDGRYEVHQWNQHNGQLTMSLFVINFLQESDADQYTCRLKKGGAARSFEVLVTEPQLEIHYSETPKISLKVATPILERRAFNLTCGMETSKHHTAFVSVDWFRVPLSPFTPSSAYFTPDSDHYPILQQPLHRITSSAEWYGVAEPVSTSPRHGIVMMKQVSQQHFQSPTADFLPQSPPTVLNEVTLMFNEPESYLGGVYECRAYETGQQRRRTSSVQPSGFIDSAFVNISIKQSRSSHLAYQQSLQLRSRSMTATRSPEIGWQSRPESNQNINLPSRMDDLADPSSQRDRTQNDGAYNRNGNSAHSQQQMSKPLPSAEQSPSSSPDHNSQPRQWRLSHVLFSFIFIVDIWWLHIFL